MKKLILAPLMVFALHSSAAESIDDAKTIKNTSPRLLKYLDKEFLDLGKKNINGISKILYSTDDSCLLFENKVINCEYKEKKKIKLTLLVNNEYGIEKQHFILVQEDVLDIQSTSNVKDKGKTSSKALKSLKFKNLRFKDQIINLNEIIAKQKAIIAEGQEDKNTIKKRENKIKSFEDIMKENREICEREKSEILSITKDNLYKEISKYNEKSQYIIKIKELEKVIKDLIRINDKQVKEEKSTKGCVLF